MDINPYSAEIPVGFIQESGSISESEDETCWREVLLRVGQKGRWTTEAMSSGYNTAYVLTDTSDEESNLVQSTYGGRYHKKDNDRLSTGTDEEDNTRVCVTTDEDKDDRHYEDKKSSEEKARKTSTQKCNRRSRKMSNTQDLLLERKRPTSNKKVENFLNSLRNVAINNESSGDEGYEFSGILDEFRSNEGLKNNREDVDSDEDCQIEDKENTRLNWSTCVIQGNGGKLQNHEKPDTLTKVKISKLLPNLKESEWKSHFEKKKLNTDEKPELVPRTPMRTSKPERRAMPYERNQNLIEQRNEEGRTENANQTEPQAAGPFQTAVEREIQLTGHQEHGWLFDADNMVSYLRHVDDGGDTNLMKCCCHMTHLAPCYFLVEQSLHYGLDINHKNSVGETALWNAAFYNQPSLVGYLLERGADPTVTVRGESVVRRCVRKGLTEVLEALFSAKTKFAIDARQGNDQKGCSLLSTAAESQQSDVIKLLVEKLLSRDDTDCLYESLTESIRSNRLDRLKYILEHAPDSQALTTLTDTCTRMTLMHEVATKDLDADAKQKFFDVLSQHGADPNAKDVLNSTPADLLQMFPEENN